MGWNKGGAELEDSKRVLFTELYEYAIYITWLVGIFIGIHIEGIYKYTPPGTTEVPPTLLITSHSHLLLMTVLLYFLNRMFRNTLATRKWPHHWTESTLVFGLIGAISFSIMYYFQAAITHGGQLQLVTYVEKMSYGGVSWPSTVYALSIMGFVILAINSRIMR